MAKQFYFWQTFSKRPNLADLAFKGPNGNPDCKLKYRKIENHEHRKKASGHPEIP